ncbi:MAG: DUF2235 domain-containing protein [Rhodobacteraceae bacterium]|nr:DUF2235 domain-containing protein [Paracoccaceae bacterium]
MKRIAIFCDGTWNKASNGTVSNVVKLAQAVRPSVADGITQQVFYQPGVGTSRGSNAVARFRAFIKTQSAFVPLVSDQPFAAPSTKVRSGPKAATGPTTAAYIIRQPGCS